MSWHGSPRTGLKRLDGLTPRRNRDARCEGTTVRGARVHSDGATVRWSLRWTFGPSRRTVAASDRTFALPHPRTLAPLPTGVKRVRRNEAHSPRPVYENRVRRQRRRRCRVGRAHRAVSGFVSDARPREWLSLL